MGTSAAIVDSGSSYLLGPKREVEAIAALMGADSDQGLYWVDCDATLPSLAFTLGGRDFALAKEDLVVAEDAGECLLGIGVGSDVEPLWILGDVFMRKYYVQFV